MLLYLAANGYEAIKKLGVSGESAGYQKGTTSELGLFGIVNGIINMALGLVGVVFLVLLIYAGYNYMTAGGDEGKVETAKATITRSVIGLVIVLLSYSISVFIIPRILCSTGVSTACPITTPYDTGNSTVPLSNP